MYCCSIVQKYHQFQTETSVQSFAATLCRFSSDIMEYLWFSNLYIQEDISSALHQTEGRLNIWSVCETWFHFNILTSDGLEKFVSVSHHTRRDA